MSELYDQIVSQRGSFERLVARLPGFKGYVDKKARRAADRMLRDHIADQYTARINRFIEIEKALLDSGGMSYMSKTRDVKTRLQHFRDRINTAAPGYSGAFEQVKVGEEELERIYSFDEAQIRFADQLDEALNTLADAVKAKSGIDDALAAVDKVTSDAAEAFSLREDVLTNLSKAV